MPRSPYHQASRVASRLGAGRDVVGESRALLGRQLLGEQPGDGAVQQLPGVDAGGARPRQHADHPRHAMGDAEVEVSLREGHQLAVDEQLRTGTPRDLAGGRPFGDLAEAGHRALQALPAAGPREALEGIDAETDEPRDEVVLPPPGREAEVLDQRRRHLLSGIFLRIVLVEPAAQVLQRPGDAGEAAVEAGGGLHHPRPLDRPLQQLHREVVVAAAGADRIEIGEEAGQPGVAAGQRRTPAEPGQLLRLRLVGGGADIAGDLIDHAQSALGGFGRQDGGPGGRSVLGAHQGRESIAPGAAKKALRRLRLLSLPPCAGSI